MSEVHAPPWEILDLPLALVLIVLSTVFFFTLGYSV